jgi:CTP:molybdopterin cytidylyltransferase MocA
MKPTRIFPIILAAGPAPRLAFPKALAKFGRGRGERTALEIAMGNCARLERPIVVLGCDAGEVLRGMGAVMRRAQVGVVVNRRWRRGQLSSLMVGLRCVPRGADFLIYPVDQPLITRGMVQRLVREFRTRGRGLGEAMKIAMPRYRGREGHPIVCAGELRMELRNAESAREIVYRDEARILFVEEKSAAIWMDFSSEGTYRRCRRMYERRKLK